MCVCMCVCYSVDVVASATDWLYINVELFIVDLSEDSGEFIDSHGELTFFVFLLAMLTEGQWR